MNRSQPGAKRGTMTSYHRQSSQNESLHPSPSVPAGGTTSSESPTRPTGPRVHDFSLAGAQSRLKRDMPNPNASTCSNRGSALPVSNLWINGRGLLSRLVFPQPIPEVVGTGIERELFHSGNSQIAGSDSAKCSALLPSSIMVDDEALREVIRAWPNLPTVLQQAILAIVCAGRDG